jgi:D-aspartate ligase
MPAVLLGGALNSLSVARSLWRLGVPVDVFDEGLAESAVRHSRSRRRYHQLRPEQDVAEQWYSRLMENCEPSVILPCCDDGLELIARERVALESVGHRPVEANDEIVLALLDKAQTYELAREVGIPAPRTMQLTDRADFDAVDETFFPCGTKPINSHVFSRRFRPFGKGTLLRTRQDLVRLVGPILDEGVPMLLTEMVEGTDECCSYYTYLEPDGTPLTHVTKRKLRQFPTRFGLGTYHLMKWDPEVAELGLRFFQGVGLRGLGNLEFKRDARDGTLKLIESNPRFTHANELVRIAGVDFGRLAYSRLAGMPLPPLDSFRDDIGLWFPVDDVRAFREYRRAGELSTVTWISTLLHRQCLPQFDWADPGPSLSNGGRHAVRLARRAIARLGSNDRRSARPDPDAIHEEFGSS